MLHSGLDRARVRRFWRACLSLGEAPEAVAPGRPRDAVPEVRPVASPGVWLGASPDTTHPAASGSAAPQSTGLPQLDEALGGGLPWGRMALVQGSLGAGKTSLCLTLTAQAQGRRRTAAWLDLDGTLTAQRAQAHGVDAANLLVLPCRDACEAFARAMTLLGAGQVGWLVIDPWPPWPSPQPTRQALRKLAQAAALAGAIVLIAQPSLDAEAHRQVDHGRNELIYITSTHLVLGLSDAMQARRNALSAPRPTRITVTKCAVLPRPNGRPMCTFIVPFCWDRGCQVGSAANNWRYI